MLTDLFHNHTQLRDLFHTQSQLKRTSHIQLTDHTQSHSHTLSKRLSMLTDQSHNHQVQGPNVELMLCAFFCVIMSTLVLTTAFCDFQVPFYIQLFTKNAGHVPCAFICYI
uniref:Uncharacterized protein n=1 Tax=Cacopsylla melanoneura TaxID=428564 RepID=A0A8D9EID3_9HEMI